MPTKRQCLVEGEYKGETFDNLEDVTKRYEYTLNSGFSTPPLMYAQPHGPSGLYIDTHPSLCRKEIGLGAFVNDARNHTNRVEGLDEEGDSQKKSELLIESGYNVAWFVVPNEPLLYLTAIRPIEPGEEFLVNYGDAFWKPFVEAEKVQKKREEGQEKTEQKNEKENLEKEKENELVST